MNLKILLKAIISELCEWFVLSLLIGGILLSFGFWPEITMGIFLVGLFLFVIVGCLFSKYTKLKMKG